MDDDIQWMRDNLGQMGIGRLEDGRTISCDICGGSLTFNAAYMTGDRSMSYQWLCDSCHNA